MLFEDIMRDMPTLETERLTLRRMRLDDAEDVFAYASDPVVTRNLTWEPSLSIDETRDFLEGVVERYRMGRLASWGVTLRWQGKLIGTCGFVDWSAENRRAEVGYALSSKYWGRGYATEALQEVLSCGFRASNLNRIHGFCDAENLASARVMEKAGMSFEGHMRASRYFKGAYHDSKLFSILKEDLSG